MAEANRLCMSCMAQTFELTGHASVTSMARIRSLLGMVHSISLDTQVRLCRHGQSSRVGWERRWELGHEMGRSIQILCCRFATNFLDADEIL